MIAKDTENKDIRRAIGKVLPRIIKDIINNNNKV